MSRIDVLRTRWAELNAVARVLPVARRLLPNAPWSPAKLLEERAREHGGRTGLLFEDQRFSWSEINREVNRTARAFREMGIEQGDVVALLMDNRPEFLFAIGALSRLRAAGALINTHITGTALAHAIRIAEPVAVLAGAEHRDKIESVLPQLEAPPKDQVWIQGEGGSCEPGPYRSFDELLDGKDGGPLDQLSEPKIEDHLGYIYTSGTTGLPKAAIVTNKRLLTPGMGMGRAILELGPDDVVYATTPLYHSVGMYLGWGATISTGAALALRRKFSASRFWDDVHRFDVSAFVYIGELCRYLLNQPANPRERGHRIRVVSGNGLRPDIWKEFQRRFAIPLVREYYGATEGNSMAINMTGRPGMVGRLMMGAKLLRCDAETGDPHRNTDGLCEAVYEGETGLFVAPINNRVPFDGYADREATKKKVLENVFKQGDRWFNSGDLLTLHEDGWVSFADRVGDTFRWKGENVSTNEVAEILNGAPGVLETNVYGVEVPGSEGRAGMASVNAGPDFSIQDLARFAVQNLPVYQRPYFVRVQQDMRITVTFKHQKVDYRREGYDPSKVSDPLYLLDGDQYVPIDAEVYASLQDGSRKLR
jgi:acyl-CoA synthetase (AMP-forming)/AMP-acid ligase II